MQPWQQRVVEEQQALDEKRRKLSAFIASDTFKNMEDWREASRLKFQARVMKQYSDILAARIAAFNA